MVNGFHSTAHAYGEILTWLRAQIIDSMACLWYRSRHAESEWSVDMKIYRLDLYDNIRMQQLNFLFYIHDVMHSEVLSRKSSICL